MTNQSIKAVLQQALEALQDVDVADEDPHKTKAAIHALHDAITQTDWGLAIGQHPAYLAHQQALNARTRALMLDAAFTSQSITHMAKAKARTTPTIKPIKNMEKATVICL